MSQDKVMVNARDGIINRLIPLLGKKLPSDFKAACALLKRPYISITEEQYQSIVQKSLGSDILSLDGQQMTFGDADGGRALMPLKQPI